MSILLNIFDNCSSDARGTGLGSCIKKYGDPTGMDLVQKGWSLAVASGTFDEAAYKALIQAETLFPINDLYNFEQNTPENERATGSTGLLSDIRQGKPFFTYAFDAGYCLHKSVYDKIGKDRWDILFKFESGLFIATDVSEANIKGFDNGMFSVDTFKFQQGTDPEMTNAVFQLRNADEFNLRGTFLTWTQLGFDGTQQNGVINAHLEYQATPAATDTVVSVKVLDDCNRSVSILGLDDPNEWVLGGTQASTTTISGVVYNASTGAYDITIDTALASADTVQPALADVSSSYSVAENSSGDFYKGTAPLVTIA